MTISALSEHNANLKVSPLFERFAIVDYGAKDGVAYLSRREKMLVDIWLATGGNVGESVRQLKAVNWRGGKVSAKAIERFLKRTHISIYLKEKIMEKALAEGYDEKKWIAEGIKYKEGKLNDYGMSYHFWKELGKALNFYRGDTNPAMQQNVQINFTQANGED